MFGFFAGQHGGAFGHDANARFQMLYNCFPMAFIGKEELEKGNRIVLPSSALEQLGRLNISYPMHFEIRNRETGKTTHCGVQEFIAEEGTVHLPYWMMQNLLITEGSIIEITNTTIPKGTYVKLEPEKAEFCNLTNQRAVLENTLRSFATLSKGDVIPIEYNNKTFYLEVVETRPANAISIVECDINVDFAPPKEGLPSPPPVTASGHYATSSNDPSMSVSGAASVTESDRMDIEEFDGPTVFHGAGNRIDGKALKHVGPAVPIANLKLTPEEILLQEEPWRNRIQGGIRREKPYGYDAANQRKFDGKNFMKK